jgi:polar amino acid transport system permease protein
VTTTADLGRGSGDDLPELYRSGRRKRQRARRNRIASYVVGVAVLALVVATGDWDKIHRYYFDWDNARAQFPEIVTIATKNTLVYTAGAFVGGVSIGLVMALLKMSDLRPYRWAATVYVEVFRGLPALLTIVIVGYLTPTALGVQFPVVLGVDTAGIVALSLVAGAYLAETIRAGVEGVPRGQVEAARSLGMTHPQTLRLVVVPQAVRLVVPPLTNEFVLLLKDTALLSALGVTASATELTKFGRDAFNQDFNGTGLMVAGVMYLIVTIPLTRLVAVLERRFKAAR